MPRSPLFGRRIHIAGSISSDLAHAPADEVKKTRDLVEGLVRSLVSKGATFVIPVDAEKLREADGVPICLDWLIWQTLHSCLIRRPAGALNPLAIAVQHHKNEEQVPPQFVSMWDDLRASALVEIENVSHWNMNSQRMEAQARRGDILVAVGGSEGVLFLANLYHDAGKPVVPLNNAVTQPDTGARRLFNFGLSSVQAPRLFRASDQTSHGWMNRINFSARMNLQERVEGVIALLEALDRPKAFAIRLLNPDHPDYSDVQDFFDTVVQPVVENDLGFQLNIVDGRQQFEQARIDQEIFARLHRSSAVLADLTGGRPNCFLELGYALGRGLPTMVMAREGSEIPFDIYTLSGLRWSTRGSADDRRRLFREHWEAIRNRPPLVAMEPLIP